MIAHAPWVPTMVPRNRVATMTVDEFMKDSSDRNTRLIAKIANPKDKALAVESWKKTQDEIDRGISAGPFLTLDDVPLKDFAIVIRKGIWEKHGTATEWRCRNIDDFLVSEQNECSGYCCVHIPATVDSLAAQTRAVQERFPTDPLHSWTSDFAKAHRQVPLCPGQLHLSVVAQWHPEMEQVVYTIPFAQLFGGRTPPLHFARHPAWFTFLLSAAIALPTHHCVDDVVGVDRVSTATETWRCWRRIAEAVGWDVPDEKSPAPSAATVALGAMLDHTPTPNASSNIWVTDGRCEAITMDLRCCWQRKTLGPGEASKLWGRLQSLSSQLHARFGRAKLGPIK